jgi:hypothetical protein
VWGWYECQGGCGDEQEEEREALTLLDGYHCWCVGWVRREVYLCLLDVHYMYRNLSP